MREIKKPPEPANSTWHQDWFDQDYLTLYSHRDHSEADRFLDHLQQHYGFSPTTDSGEQLQVLDLGCGNGRYTNELARRGFCAVGLDWSPHLLRAAVSEKGQGHFIRADMHQPPFAAVFDWVLSLFTSFGYNEDDKQNEKLLMRMAALVKPGGRLVIDYLNPPALKKNLVAKSQRRVGDWPVEEKRWIDNSHNMVRKEIRFTPTGKEPRVVCEAVKLYDANWFLETLENLGFQCQAHLGELDGSHWQPGSSRSILILDAPQTRIDA